MNLDRWLDAMGLGQYAALFRSNDIDDELLPRLTADDLKDIGVTSVGHRRRLLEAIAALSATPANQPPAPTAVEPQHYTPKHLAEKILLSRSGLEGERKQVTCLLYTSPSPRD